MNIREAFSGEGMIWGFLGGDGEEGLVFITNDALDETVFTPAEFNSNLYRMAKEYVMHRSMTPYVGDWEALGTSITTQYVKFKLKYRAED